MEVAIGPVTGHTLYGYRSGSHMLFYIYSHACLFYRFVVLTIHFANRILVFHVQF